MAGNRASQRYEELPQLDCWPEFRDYIYGSRVTYPRRDRQEIIQIQTSSGPSNSSETVSGSLKRPRPSSSDIEDTCSSNRRCLGKEKAERSSKRKNTGESSYGSSEKTKVERASPIPEQLDSLPPNFKLYQGGRLFVNPQPEKNPFLFD